MRYNIHCTSAAAAVADHISSVSQSYVANFNFHMISYAPRDCSMHVHNRTL